MGGTYGRRAIPGINGDEVDYLGDIAPHNRGRRGRKPVKRAYRRRERRWLKRHLD